MQPAPSSEWSKVEWYTSKYGTVTRTDGGEWVARVKVVVNGVEKEGRIAETFVSAEVAMGAVVRTWERYQAKAKGESV